MQTSEIQYDWFELTPGKVEWLCMLYDWSLIGSPDTWALIGELLWAKELEQLGCVDTTGFNDPKRPVLVRITLHGKQLLENCYPVELLTFLISESEILSYAHTVRATIAKIVKCLPLEVAPLFLVHQDSKMREIGKTMVERR